MRSGWKFSRKLKEATNSLKQWPHATSDSLTTTKAVPFSDQASSIASQPKHREPICGAGGTLSITIVEAEGLSVPPGIHIPEVIQKAVDENPKVGSLTVGSLTGGQRSDKKLKENIQRKCNWWLPYLVLEFDKNEVLVKALGGTIGNPVWIYKADFDVSRSSEITLSTYLRTSPNANDKNANMNNGTGRFHLQVAFHASKNTPLTIESFELLQVIWKGSFGKVMQVRKKDTGRIYAMKTIRKAHIVTRSKVTHTLAERTVLGQVHNPFIVPLKFSFQNSRKALLGSFKEGRFSEERSRLYAAELLCAALEHLHAYDVVYRDLKPENILLDYTGHIAFCDFGLCKLNMGESEKTNTFCGTLEYLSPELLLGQGYTKSVDWWTLGVLIYEMLSGLPPYYDENVHAMYRKILYNPLTFGPEIKIQARSLLTGLLTRNPMERLGSNGAEEIKRHPFFYRIDWKRLMLKQYTPPFKPNVVSSDDTSNFDSEFTNEAPMDSVVEDSHLSETVQQKFIGFTYNPTGNFMGGESVR